MVVVRGVLSGGQEVLSCVRKPRPATPPHFWLSLAHLACTHLAPNYSQPQCCARFIRIYPAASTHQHTNDDPNHALLHTHTHTDKHTFAIADPSALLTARRAMLTGRHTLRPRPSGRTSSARNLFGARGVLVGVWLMVLCCVGVSQVGLTTRSSLLCTESATC